MKQNPVYNREMRVSSRSMKLPLIIFLFNGILFLVTLLNMYSVIMQVKASASIQYSSFMELYEFVTSMEFILLMFIVPAVTASAISGERERQTLDLMLTTQMSAGQIVTGKLLSALSTLFLLILSSFPAVAMVFVYGGITWTDAFSLILCYVTVAFFAGSIGICFSAAFKRSTVSTVVTYGTLTAVVAGTYFLNRFALSVSGMDLQRSAAYVLGESSAKASSGGFFYLFLFFCCQICTKISGVDHAQKCLFLTDILLHCLLKRTWHIRHITFTGIMKKTRQHDSVRNPPSCCLFCTANTMLSH